MLNKAQDDDLVMSLVELALARPADERQASLVSACEGDTELFDQAWKYVQWEQSMNGFLLDPLYPSSSCEKLFEPGELLDGRFRIVREVAQGGMGVVYEAMDEKLERRTAIKCAKVGFGKRLPHEVRNATKISHPNVCKTFEIHTAATKRGDIDFLTMEFIEGETLAERLRREPPTTKEAVTIARQLCGGLAEAHHNQVIHGDLKTNNVILSTGGDGKIRAVITDFGLACGLEAAQQGAESEELGGTPRYMAPELWKGERPSVASDLYALGVILSELRSERQPPLPQMRGSEQLRKKRLIRNPFAVHTKLDRLYASCLDPDPARRPPNADELLQALVAPGLRQWFLGAMAAVVLAALTGLVTYLRATTPHDSGYFDCGSPAGFVGSHKKGPIPANPP
jgi:serine/threonine protein kinase